jgi:uracil-DNA glycosylase
LDFAEAQKEALGCTKCGLCHSRTQVVFGEGPLNAELFIVGEAPGFNEDKEGRPFRGASGMLLDRLLNSLELGRERVYLTTLVKCRPPGSPPRPPRPSEVSACRPYLVTQLAAVDPKVVVAMGDLASRVLTGRKESASRIRGRAIPLDGRYVFPTLSLVRALYTPADRALLISDYSRLPELLEAERPSTYDTLNVPRASAVERESLQPGLW